MAQPVVAPYVGIEHPVDRAGIAAEEDGIVAAMPTVLQTFRYIALQEPEQAK